MVVIERVLRDGGYSRWIDSGDMAERCVGGVLRIDDGGRGWYTRRSRHPGGQDAQSNYNAN